VLTSQVPSRITILQLKRLEIDTAIVAVARFTILVARVTDPAGAGAYGVEK
jgi:hypothetical protein